MNGMPKKYRVGRCTSKTNFLIRFRNSHTLKINEHCMYDQNKVKQKYIKDNIKDAATITTTATKQTDKTDNNETKVLTSKSKEQSLAPSWSSFAFSLSLDFWASRNRGNFMWSRSLSFSGVLWLVLGGDGLDGLPLELVFLWKKSDTA